MNVIVYIVGIIGIFLAIYVNLPQPDLSSKLTEWKRNGTILNFKGMNIFYIDEAGSGSSGPLICLHGFPSSSYDWIKILPQLKQQFTRIVLLDFLGFGFSDKPKHHTYTIAEQADIVEELTTYLNIKNSHILAHDYGDTVALELLARHNSKQIKFQILSLVMLNGGVFPETHHPRLIQKILLTPVLGYIAGHFYCRPIFSIGFSEIFGNNKPTPEDIQDFWAAIRYNNGDRVFYRLINYLRERQIFKKKWVGALQLTHVNVLMIYGPADPINPPEFASLFRNTVPHPIVTLASNIGHYPQLEDPYNVGRELLDFVKKLTV
uniref:AB hydrolase-1 domain-containing protein n=3 Tax=Arion vulgaris TaxID=1028688 RepID=A0A0B6YYJ5_9EUPU